MRALRTTLRHQERRSHYKPRGVPYKVVWDKASMFKLLILRMSEEYEKKQDSLDAPSSRNLFEEDLIVRYVKCLLFETMSRNSFHATIGVCKLLYNYSFRETEAIYTWLFPDFKDDAAFRRAKIRIKSSLSKRFGRYLEEDFGGITNEPNASTIPELNWKFQLVETTLELFKPTAISCLPTEFFREYYLWEEQLTTTTSVTPDHLEKIRIHVVVCPSCFKMLNLTLGHKLPSERLALPKFSTARGEGWRVKCGMGDVNLPNLTLIDVYKVLVDMA